MIAPSTFSSLHFRLSKQFSRVQARRQSFIDDDRRAAEAERTAATALTANAGGARMSAASAKAGRCCSANLAGPREERIRQFITDGVHGVLVVTAADAEFPVTEGPFPTALFASRQQSTAEIGDAGRDALRCFGVAGATGVRRHPHLPESRRGLFSFRPPAASRVRHRRHPLFDFSPAPPSTSTAAEFGS